MKKQFIIEWTTKKGNDGWKSLGYDLSDEEVEKQLRNKIKKEHIATVWITWNPVGSDVPDSQYGKETYVKGYRKEWVNLFGAKCWFEDEIQEI